MSKMEGSLTAIDNNWAEQSRAKWVTHAEQMRAEKATLEQRNREAIRFREEEFAQKRKR